MDKENKQTNTAASGGISFCGVLTILFIALKLIGVINWSWWWVLSPVWIPFGICIAVAAVVLIIALCKAVFVKEKKK